MELLLASGGGRGLFEDSFLFGTASDEVARDGDNPNIDLVVDFEFFSGPSLVKSERELIRKRNFFRGITFYNVSTIYILQIFPSLYFKILYSV